MAAIETEEAVLAAFTLLHFLANTGILVIVAGGFTLVIEMTIRPRVWMHSSSVKAQGVAFIAVKADVTMATRNRPQGPLHVART
jgi:hypothetical protein